MVELGITTLSGVPFKIDPLVKDSLSGVGKKTKEESTILCDVFCTYTSYAIE